MDNVPRVFLDFGMRGLLDEVTDPLNASRAANHGAGTSLQSGERHQAIDRRAFELANIAFRVLRARAGSPFTKLRADL